MSDNFTPMPYTSYKMLEAGDEVITTELAPGLAVRTDVQYDADVFNRPPTVTSFIFVDGVIEKSITHDASREADLFHGYVVGLAMAAYNFMKNSV